MTGKSRSTKTQAEWFLIVAMTFIELAGLVYLLVH